MFNRTPGGGVLLMMAYTGRLRPKGLPSFFRLQVYERVGASPRKHFLTTPPPPRDRNAFYCEDLILMAKIHVTLLLEKIKSE